MKITIEPLLRGKDMKITIEPLFDNEYWIDFQEPENDRTPYVRIFNKHFTLEKKGNRFILIGESTLGQDFMWNKCKSSVTQTFMENDMIDRLKWIIREFFKDVYNIEFKP